MPVRKAPRKALLFRRYYSRIVESSVTLVSTTSACGGCGGDQNRPFLFVLVLVLIKAEYSLDRLFLSVQEAKKEIVVVKHFCNSYG